MYQDFVFLTPADERLLLSLEKEFKDVEFLKEEVQRRGGANLDIIRHLEKIYPGCVSQSVSLESFGSSYSATNIEIVMESISLVGGVLIAAIVAVIARILYKLYQWLTGNSSSSNSGNAQTFVDNTRKNAKLADELVEFGAEGYGSPLALVSDIFQNVKRAVDVANEQIKPKTPFTQRNVHEVMEEIYNDNFSQCLEGKSNEITDIFFTGSGGNDVKFITTISSQTVTASMELSKISAELRSLFSLEGGVKSASDDAKENFTKQNEEFSKKIIEIMTKVFSSFGLKGNFSTDNPKDIIKGFSTFVGEIKTSYHEKRNKKTEIPSVYAQRNIRFIDVFNKALADLDIKLISTAVSDANSNMAHIEKSVKGAPTEKQKMFLTQRHRAAYAATELSSTNFTNLHEF